MWVRRRRRIPYGSGTADRTYSLTANHRTQGCKRADLYRLFLGAASDSQQISTSHGLPSHAGDAATGFPGIHSGELPFLSFRIFSCGSSFRLSLVPGFERQWLSVVITVRLVT